MTQIAIEFNITPGSFFINTHMSYPYLFILIETSKSSTVSNFNQKSLIKSSMNKKKIRTNNLENNTQLYLYDIDLIKFKHIEVNYNRYFESFINLQPRAYQKNIISINDSVLFLHPKKYIQVEQELDATNENILDSSIKIRIQNILEILKLV